MNNKFFYLILSLLVSKAAFSQSRCADKSKDARPLDDSTEKVVRSMNNVARKIASDDYVFDEANPRGKVVAQEEITNAGFKEFFIIKKDAEYEKVSSEYHNRIFGMRITFEDGNSQFCTTTFDAPSLEFDLPMHCVLPKGVFQDKSKLLNPYFKQRVKIQLSNGKTVYLMEGTLENLLGLKGLELGEINADEDIISIRPYGAAEHMAQELFSNELGLLTPEEVRKAKMKLFKLENGVFTDETTIFTSLIPTDLKIKKRTRKEIDIIGSKITNRLVPLEKAALKKHPLFALQKNASSIYEYKNTDVAIVGFVRSRDNKFHYILKKATHSLGSTYLHLGTSEDENGKYPERGLATAFIYHKGGTINAAPKEEPGQLSDVRNNSGAMVFVDDGKAPLGFLVGDFQYEGETVTQIQSTSGAR